MSWLQRWRDRRRMADLRRRNARVCLFCGEERQLVVTTEKIRLWGLRSGACEDCAQKFEVGPLQ